MVAPPPFPGGAVHAVVAEQGIVGVDVHDLLLTLAGQVQRQGLQRFGQPVAAMGRVAVLGVAPLVALVDDAAGKPVIVLVVTGLGVDAALVTGFRDLGKVVHGRRGPVFPDHMFLTIFRVTGDHEPLPRVEGEGEGRVFGADGVREQAR